MRFFYSFIVCVLISIACAYSQAPNISYTTPQVYGLNNTITPLKPVNTGGPVPATIYGKVSTFAGSGFIGSANGVGTNASFSNPYNSAFDAAGNFYVADCNNQLIRKIITPTSAVVTTFAGSGNVGYADGSGTTASFNNPGGITTDVAGNVYIGDQTNNLIRKITPAGLVTTFAGNTAGGLANGTIANASFLGPAGLIFDSFGNLYIADRRNNVVRKITPSGVVSTFAGSGSAGFANGTGTTASFNNPTSMAVDAYDNVYVTDQYNNAIRKITQAGVVTTFAGSGVQGSSNGAATVASFYKPFSLSFDVSGNLYVADEFNNLIRQITPLGVVTTLAGNGSQNGVDGVGTSASFNYPSGVAPDGLGNLYVTETGGQRIRKIIITGYVIDKPLPAGLVFDQTTGIISGTPTVASPPTNYLVTAYNTNGSSSTIVNITVSALLPEVIVFLPIANVPYGSADITPVAVSTNLTIPITYTSSNPAVATITADGKIHIVGAGTVTITASQAGNALFTPATPVSQTFTVTPVPLNITIADETKVYGAANPVAAFSYSGFVNGDDQTRLTAQPVVATAVTTTSPVGTYSITGTGAASPNYTITYTPGKLTVTPAPLTITAVNASRVYGVANPTFAVTYVGFVAGDDASKLTTAPTISTTANINSPVGTYSIDVSGAVDANYNISYVAGKLTITPVSRTLTFNPIPTKGTGDPDFDPGASTSTNDVIIYTSSDPSVAIIVNGKIHIVGPGTAVITATVASRANYADIPSQSQVLTVLVDPSQFVAIHPVVTPNGDGINDVLKIDGIANYPNNKITLVNLNGIKVFEADSYDNINNTFDGHSNITGSFQPQGTYYYSLQFIVNGQKKRRVGFIVLKY